MDGFTKVIMFVLLVAYVVSPVDCCPGPIDDILAIMLYVAANKSNAVKD